MTKSLTTRILQNHVSTLSILMVTESIPISKTPRDATLRSLVSTTVRMTFGSRTIFPWTPIAVVSTTERNISTTPIQKTTLLTISCPTTLTTMVFLMLLKTQLGLTGAIPILTAVECLTERNVLNNSGSSIALELHSTSSTRPMTCHRTMLSSGRTTQPVSLISTLRSIGGSTPMTFLPAIHTHMTMQSIQVQKWCRRSQILHTWQVLASRTIPSHGKLPTISL